MIEHAGDGGYQQEQRELEDPGECVCVCDNEDCLPWESNFVIVLHPGVVMKGRGRWHQELAVSRHVLPVYKWLPDYLQVDVVGNLLLLDLV